jgi:hypothetical protein
VRLHPRYTQKQEQCRSGIDVEPDLRIKLSHLTYKEFVEPGEKIPLFVKTKAK